MKKITVLIMFVLALPIYAMAGKEDFVGKYDLYDVYNDEGGNRRVEKMAYAEFKKNGTCVISSSRSKTESKFTFTATKEKISERVVYELKLYDSKDGNGDEIIQLISLDKTIIPELKNEWNANSFINSDYVVGGSMFDGIVFIRK